MDKDCMKDRIARCGNHRWGSVSEIIVEETRLIGRDLTLENGPHSITDHLSSVQSTDATLFPCETWSLGCITHITS